MTTITLSNATIAADAISGTAIGQFNQDGVRFQGPTRPAYLLIVGRAIVADWDGVALLGQIPIQVHAPGGPPTSFVITITAAAVKPPPPPPPPAISPDGTTSAAPSGPALHTAAGTWAWSSAAAGRPGEYSVNLNGAAVGIGLLMEVANGGQLYVDTAHLDWYLWGNNGFATSAGPATPPPPAAAPVITVAPIHPQIPDTTPKGAMVATYSVAMSDGTPFVGKVQFGAPNFDAGGIFALAAATPASGQIIVNPAGPGVGPNAGTITDHITLEAVS